MRSALAATPSDKAMFICSAIDRVQKHRSLMSGASFRNVTKQMRHSPLSPAILFPSERIDLLHGDSEEEMDTCTPFNNFISLHYHDSDTEEDMDRHPSQTIEAACSTSGRETESPASQRWGNSGHRTDLLHHRKIVLRRPTAHVPPLLVHLDRKLPTSLSPDAWTRPFNGLSHRIETRTVESEGIPNRGKRRKRRYRMTISRTSSADLFSAAESHASSSSSSSSSSLSSTTFFIKTYDASWMFLHYTSDDWKTIRTATLHQVNHQRNILAATIPLPNDVPSGMRLVVSRTSKLDWKDRKSLPNVCPPLDCGSLSGAHLWLDPISSSNQSSVEVRISQMLAKPAALVVDSTLMAGKRHDRDDEKSRLELRQLLERSQQVHPQLLICSSSRTYRSFVEDLWSDKKHSLPKPDILLLAGGSQIAYQTPAGWSMDESWSNRLSRSWDRAAVQRAAERAIKSISQLDQEHQALGGQRARLRVKLDTWKQQCPLRLRLLVSDPSPVVQILDRCLTDEAKMLSHLQWEIRVQKHVEGGGASHCGWSAVDIVPTKGSLDQALAYVLTRFHIQADTVAGVLDASSGLGAACAPSIAPSSGTPQKHNLFGLGVVMVNKEEKAPRRYTFGPRSVLEGLNSLGLFSAV